MTEFLFRADPYLKSAEAVVTTVTDEGAVILDRTIFYATSGGQPGDTGRITANGRTMEVIGAFHPDASKTEIAHILEGEPPAIGDTVTLDLDWERRYRLMRMHTALHLLSVVFPFAVTGGSVGTDKGRLDFDMPQVPGNVTELEARLNAWIAENHPVTAEWITDDEMKAQPDLVKTMTVKPPMGQGRVRLIRVGAPGATVDLQPCGGTHVASTGEIGPVRVGKIEKKGRQNRRVNLHFDQ